MFEKKWAFNLVIRDDLVPPCSPWLQRLAPDSSLLLIQDQGGKWMAQELDLLPPCADLD